MFVTKINAEQNQIVLGKAGSQYAKQLVAGDINWISIERLTEPLKATAKTRYQLHLHLRCCYQWKMVWYKLCLMSRSVPLHLDKPVVFYDGDTVIGGGTILNNNA